MNGQVEVTRRTLLTIEHSLMVHARVLEAYIHFALISVANNILLVISIRDPINKDGELATPYKLATGIKPSISYLHVLLCPCVVRKATAHVGTKALNMRHQAQNGFRGIFVGIPLHQKRHIVYVLHKWKIVSLYDVVF